MVGTQYLILVLALFGVGGTLAMMIRTQLVSNRSSFLDTQTYNAVVSIHGMVMIIATIIMVTGPFTNFIMPIMIGAKDMAFPRLNALSFWLVASAVPAAGHLRLGGGQRRMDDLRPPVCAGSPAMDAFAIAIIAFAISVTIAAMNIIVTIFTMRAKGMSLGRLPIFIWGTVVGGALGLYAMPAFLMDMMMMITDRATGTSFFVRPRAAPAGCTRTCSGSWATPRST